MKRLHEKVNVIPLIAKADTLTPEESQQFKKQVRASALSPAANTRGSRPSASLVDGQFFFCSKSGSKCLSPLLQIMREIAEHKIKIYEFPETDDEEENRLVKKIKVLTSHPATRNTH